jgi:hypothetical protein
MTDYPTLSKGAIPPGTIKYHHLNDLFRSSEDFETFIREYSEAQKLKAEKHTEYLFAKITDNELLSAYRWKYAWDEVKLTTDTWDTFTGARTGSFTTDYALNMCEASNDGLDIEAPGTDVEGSAYPGTFDLVAIQGEPVVVMHAFRDTTGAIRYAFSLANDHDGTCA